jgi:hypothetical protein
MQLTPPKQWVFWVAAALAIIGLLSTFVAIPFVSGYALWVIFLGWLLLAAGNAMAGM